MQQLNVKLQPWPEGPSSPELSSEQIDIWQVDMNKPLSTASADSVLSLDEHTRAKRFFFEEDRLHFTRRRSALRLLLSRYLGIPAADIRFEYQPGGKPELAVQQNSRRLCFNVSHSGRLVLIAVSADRRIGVDIEKKCADVEITVLAKRFFSSRERAGLRALPDFLRVAAFFACWTRKESFLKATGAGLSFPLADFSVTTHPDLDPALEEIGGNSEARKQWALADLTVVDGYRATVAIEGSLSRLEMYTL
jgi:4'-phosphopantetheinyl transferase